MSHSLVNMACHVYAVAAFVCDPLFVPGLVYFDIAPAVDEQSVRAAFVRGAAFGLVTYATWDVTSLAVIEGFPVGIVPIDMAWAASSRRRSARRRAWCCAASPSVVRDVLESGRTSGRAV